MVPGANEGLPNSLSSGNRPDDRRQTSTVSVNGQNDVAQQQPDRRHGQQRALHRDDRRAAVGGRDRRGEGADQHVHRRNRPYRRRRGEHPDQVGHQRLPRLGLRLLPQREVRRLRLLRPARPAQAAAAPAAVGRQPRRPHHQEPDVLLRRLRALPPGARPDLGQHRADGGRCATATSRSCWPAASSSTIRRPRRARRSPATSSRPSRIDPIGAEFLNLYPLPNAAGPGQQLHHQRDPRADLRHLRRAPGPPLHRQPQRSTCATRTTPWRRWCPACSASSTASIRAARRPGSAGRRWPMRGGSTPTTWRSSSRRCCSRPRSASCSSTPSRCPRPIGQNIATSFGLQGVNIDERTSGLPNFTVAGYTVARRPALRADPAQERHLAGAGLADQRPRRAQPARRRRHRPADLWRRSRATTAPGSTPSPPTPTNNGAGGGGDAAAAFLLGYPFTVSRAHLVVDTTLETWEPSVFVQDDWRANEWLTLNLGAPLRHLHAVHRGGRRDLEPRHQHAAVPDPRAERRRRHRRREDRLRQHRAAPRVRRHGAAGHGDPWRLRPELLPVVDGLQRRAAQHALHLHLRRDERGGLGRAAERVLLHAAADAACRARRPWPAPSPPSTPTSSRAISTSTTSCWSSSCGAAR